MITKIPWNEGEGHILAEYSGLGDGPLLLSSSTMNPATDRSQFLQVAATDHPLSVSVCVTQSGLRQSFLTRDEIELHGSDGTPFLVLK